MKWNIDCGWKNAAFDIIHNKIIWERCLYLFCTWLLSELQLENLLFNNIIKYCFIVKHH